MGPAAAGAEGAVGDCLEKGWKSWNKKKKKKKVRRKEKGKGIGRDEIENLSIELFFWLPRRVFQPLFLQLNTAIALTWTTKATSLLVTSGASADGIIRR